MNNTTTRICLKRMQDLVSFNDCYCKECWESDVGHSLQHHQHLDREECFKENAVTEEEFARTFIQKGMESQPRQGTDTAQSRLADDIEVDQLKHLVRLHPREAMECLSFHQMLRYILEHKNIPLALERAKAALLKEGV